MYHVVRRIHLFSGLVLLLFILMYFVSGYIIVHRPWFGRAQPATVTRKVAWTAPAGLADEEISQYIQETFGLRGQRAPANHRSDGSVRFNFVRPGTTFEALLQPGSKELTITEKHLSAADIANGMHRLHGYHGGWFYYLWAFVYDLASTGLIVFALSGVVLWYQSTTHRLAGYLCLGASVGFTAAMISYLLFSK